MSGEKQAAEVFNEICYAAFSTHFRTVFAARLTDGNAHEAAKQHWDDNLPGIANLWHGLVKGMLVNVQTAQNEGTLPAFLKIEPPPPAPLPGLGGPTGGNGALDLPAALATRLARDMRAKVDAAAARSPLQQPQQQHSSRDVVPGLAVGRETETDE